MSPHLVDQRLQFREHYLKLCEVICEGVFRANGFPDSVGPHLAIVDAARNPIIVRTGLSKIGLHEIERLVAHVEASVKPEGIHLYAGRRSDAVKFADGQGFNKRRPRFRCDDILAVRFAMIRRELCQKLVVGDAGGRVEAGLLFDLGADGERDVARQRNSLQVFRDVEIGLVQRQRFNDRGVLGEDLSDLLGNRLVDLEARLYENEAGIAASPSPTA